MKKFILSAFIVLLCNVGYSVTFNQTNGTGSITTNEVLTAYSWTTDKGLQFIGAQNDAYTAMVRYKDIKGNLVTQAMTINTRTYMTIKVKKTAAGYDFVGYGTPNLMNPVPKAGGSHIFSYTDKTTIGEIISVNPVPVTTVKIMGFAGIYGYRNF